MSKKYLNNEDGGIIPINLSLFCHIFLAGDARFRNYTRFKSTTRSIVPLGAVIETFLTIVPFL
jgi:hypothetical protein